MTRFRWLLVLVLFGVGQQKALAMHFGIRRVCEAAPRMVRHYHLGCLKEMRPVAEKLSAKEDLELVLPLVPLRAAGFLNSPGAAKFFYSKEHDLACVMGSIFTHQGRSITATRLHSNPGYSLESPLALELIELAKRPNEKQEACLVNRWTKRHQALTRDESGQGIKLKNKSARSLIENYQSLYRREPNLALAIMESFLLVKASSNQGWLSDVLQRPDLVKYLGTKPFIPDDADGLFNNLRGLSCAQMIKELGFNPSLTLYAIGLNASPRHIPPRVNTMHCQGKKSGRNHADCVESSLRDFANALFFDGQSSFDCSAILGTPLYEFYQNHCQNVVQVNQQDTAQAWFDLTTDIKRAAYWDQDQCELDASALNIIKVFNHLLGLNATRFKELGEQLSRPNFKVELKIPHCDERLSDVGVLFTTVDFHVTKADGSTIFGRFNFDGNHAHIFVPERDQLFLSEHQNHMAKILTCLDSSHKATFSFYW